MARPNKIWFRKDRKTWFVRIDGQLHNLGPDKDIAEKKFHSMKALEAPIVGIHAAVLMDKFLMWVGEHKAPATLHWYKKHLQHFLDKLPNQGIDASAIKPFHVYEAMGQWGQNYKRGFCVAIQRCFRWGVKQGYLTSSPLASLEKPMSERRDNCPTKADVDAILEHATEPFKSLLLFLLETACRPQEAIAIRQEYLHGDKIIFPVKKSKGKKYARVIYLTERAQSALKASGGCFCNRSGTPWTAFSINCRMRRISEKTGKHFAAYDLRHYTITRWLESGLDHITVARLAGHQDSSMVARVYGHIGEKNDYLLDALNRVS